MVRAFLQQKVYMFDMREFHQPPAFISYQSTTRSAARDTCYEKDSSYPDDVLWDSFAIAKA